MASKRISELPDALPVAGDRIPFDNASGATKSTTVANLAEVVLEEILLEIPAATESFENIRVLDSFAALLSLAAVAGSKPKAVFLRGYHASRPGVGEGIWVFNANSTFGTSLGFVQCVDGGSYEPRFENSNINICRFGAFELDTGTTTNSAVNEAFALQQNVAYNHAKHLYFPAGEWQVTTAKVQLSPGNGSGFQVNNSGGYPIGTTNITVDSGKAGTTYAVGAGITFSTNRNDRYRVVESTSTLLRIDPPLRLAVADNATIFSFSPRLHVRGTGTRSMASGFQRSMCSSMVRMMTANTPIFEIREHEGSIVGINFEYNSTPSSGHTEAACIKMALGTDLLRWEFRNIGYRRCGYGFRLDPGDTDGGTATSGFSITNCRFDHIYGISSVITGMFLNAAGTPNDLSSIYLQNIDDNLQNRGNITGYSRSGATLTLTASSLPINFGVGTYFVTSGLPGKSDDDHQGHDNQFVCKTLTGSSNPWTITVEYTDATTALLDPLTPVSGATTVANFTQNSSYAGVGPLLYIGNGFHGTWGSVDCEGNRSNVANGVPLIINKGETVMGLVHLEYAGGTGGGIRLVENQGGGNLSISAVTCSNMSIPPGDTHYLFSNKSKGAFRVGTVTIRDIADVGGFFELARNDTGCPPVHIDQVAPSVTVRANAKSEWPFSAATTNPTVDYGNRLQDVRPVQIVGTCAATYGNMFQITTSGQATGFAAVNLPRPVRDLQGVWSGLCRKNVTGVPVEVAMGSDYEIHVTVEQVQSDLTTKIGVPLEFTFKRGSRIFSLVKSGTFEESDPAGYFPAGWYIFRTFASRLASVSPAPTVAGDQGVMAADQSYFPRNDYLGGAQGTDGVCGMVTVSIASQATLLPGTWDKTGSGAYTPTSFGGPAPCAIIGRFADRGDSRVPWAVIGDSISDGVGDALVLAHRRSGLGFFVRGINDRFPIFQASQGGNDIKYFVGTNWTEWSKRAKYILMCEGAFIYLGTNGLNAGDSAATVIANLTSYFTLMRNLGMKRIISATICPRGTSTNGFLDGAGQTPASGFQAKANTVNDWLLGTAKTSGLIDYCVDFRLVVSPSLGSALWADAEVIDTTTVSASPTPTTTAVPIPRSLADRAYQGYYATIGSQTRLITSHPAHSGGVTTLTCVAFSPAPTAGQTITITSPMVDVDGIHPSPYGHYKMGLKINEVYDQFLIKK